MVSLCAGLSFKSSQHSCSGIIQRHAVTDEMALQANNFQTKGVQYNSKYGNIIGNPSTRGFAVATFSVETTNKEI